MPPVAATLTIEPPPARSIARPAARQVRNAPVRFTSRTRCHPRSSGTSSAGADQKVAALLTSTSRRPKRSVAARTSRSTSSSSVTSAASAVAGTP